MAINKNWAEVLQMKLDAVEGMLRFLKENLLYKKDKTDVQIIINNIKRSKKKIKDLKKRHLSNGIIKY